MKLKINSILGDMPELPPQPSSDVRLINGEDGNDGVPHLYPNNGNDPDFEDWFENDLHSDSADEELEENIVIIDPSEHSAGLDGDRTDGVSQLEHCFREGFQGELMIPRLLDEAMRDVVEGPEVYRPQLQPGHSNMKETFTSDEHFFNKDQHLQRDDDDGDIGGVS